MQKMKMASSKKTLKGVFMAIVLILIFLAIRLIGIGKPLFTDEMVWAISSQTRVMSIFTIMPLPEGSWFFPHPPLGPLMYVISTSLFGLYAWSMRLVPLLFGISTLVITCLTAQKLYGRKAALISLGIMGISFWHILASLQVDIDGAILAFFFASFLYCLVNYEEKRNRFWKILSGICLGLSFLTKYAAIFLPIIAVVYILILKRNLRKSIQTLFPIFAIGAAIFLVFPVFSFIFEKGLFMDTLMWGSRNAGRGLSLRPFIYLLFYATPLLFGNAALSLIRPKRQDTLLWLWILVPLIFYIFYLGSPAGPFERYLMVIIPALSVLSGKFIAELKLNGKHLLLAGIAFLAFFIILLSINLGESRYLVHDPGRYIAEAMSLRWDFNFPYVGSSGPQFWITFSAMAVSLILSVWLMAAYVLARLTAKDNLSRQLFALFIGIALAFNLLLAQEYLLGLTHPSPERATLEFADYSSKNPLQEPVYSILYQQGVYFYTNISSYNRIPLFSDENLEEIRPALLKSGGSVVLVDFPGFSRDSKSFGLLSGCELIKTISDKSKELIYVYDCETLNVDVNNPYKAG